MDRQKLFIDEYLIDLNATRAAIRAGYSERTAGSVGPALLKNPLVARHIQNRMKEIAEKTGLVIEDVLYNIEKTRQAAMDAGKHVSVLKALELQGRYLGMFTQKINHGGSVRVYNYEP